MRKRLFKKLVSVAIMATMSMSLFTACGKENDAKDTENVVEDAKEEKDENYPLNLTAVEATVHMGNGINLGNTLEAYGHDSYGIDAPVATYETSWGQPYTTKEMIAGMKASGFDTIRIPIAWTNMMDYENGDYTINQAYLERVAEVVTWAIDEEMFVIINDHWDGGWWGMFGSETEATRENAMEMYTSMWTQISNTFKGYNGYLIFESGNEEIGSRLNDRDKCPDSGSLSEDECYETANKINQAFVDTVRATGGVNAERFLLIAGYDTNIAATRDKRFVMPKDTVENKLMVSVHYYDPWGYCGGEEQADWGIKSEYNTLIRSISSLSQFTDSGYGVVIGEFGALPTKTGELKNNTIEFTSAMLDLCTKYNLCPVLWDRGDFYSKTEYKIKDDELAKLYADNKYSVEEKSSRDDLIANADKRVTDAVAKAPSERELIIDNDAIMAEGSTAWIMWSGFKATYSVGDKYDSTSATGGVVATDAKINGAGTYTVALDFSGVEGGFDSGFSFSAIGLSNGEIINPGYFIDIKEVKVNGEVYELIAEPFTTADDKICTRVNLYNQWVTNVPPEARTIDGTPEDSSAIVIDNTAFTQIKSIEITFDYVAP